MSPLGERLPPRFSSVDDVVAGLAEVERSLAPLESGLEVFATAYLMVTRIIRRRLSCRSYCDGAAVSGYVVAFANLYRGALVEWANGRRDRVPYAWRIAFDSAARGRRSVVHDLLLGINAHINRDLPYAALEAGLDPGCARNYADHTSLNEALEVATPRVRRRVTWRYRRRLLAASYLAGPLIDRAVMASFRAAREAAWRNARALARAGGAAQRSEVARAIELRAARTARRMAAEAARPFRCIELLGGGGGVAVA